MKKIIITLCFLILTSISLGQKISEKRLKKEEAARLKEEKQKQKQLEKV